VKSPDGYGICPSCRHNTCQALAGRCTVMNAEFFFTFMGSPYCDCDCYKALHGISLPDRIAKTLWGEREENDAG
jgi:hypothetical protein